MVQLLACRQRKHHDGCVLGDKNLVCSCPPMEDYMDMD